MTKEDLSAFQKLINASLMKFWEEVLEPVMATKEDLGEVKEELKSEINDLGQKVESMDRKLDAEVGYRDRLEKRVVVVENKSNTRP